MKFDDRIHSFRPAKEDEHGLDLSQYLRSFQAQQEFMMRHVNPAGDGFRPSAGLRAGCPFLRCCSHLNRDQFPENCSREPWMQYSQAAVGCWYANGVAATVGRHTVKKIGS
jgi:hypothetical protein